MSTVCSPTATGRMGLLKTSMPTRRKVYWAATSARLAMTMTSATMMAQPVSQPRCGPIARVTQVKLVPQSGSARLR